MENLFKYIIELPKSKKIIIGILFGIVLVLFLLKDISIGSNNTVQNNNNGIQGNGNFQNNKLVYNIKSYLPPKEKPFKEDFTKSKQGLLVVTSDWKKKWKPYFTIYENFVDIQTPKGYLLLNSPKTEDLYKTYLEKDVEVSGYIRTNNGIFYMTKYSYTNRQKDGFPKFIYPIK